MKIALIEIYQHLELIRDLARVLNYMSYEVTVCTNNFCYDLIDTEEKESSRWIVVKDKKQWATIIRSVSLENDLILFTTMPYDTPGLIGKGLPKPTVCIVHNGHHFISPLRHAALWRQPSLKNLIRLFNTIANRRQLFKISIDQDVSFTFMSQSVFENLSTINSQCWQKMRIIETPSFVFPEPCPRSFTSANSNLKIVVPGTLSYNTKDLSTLYKAFELTLKKEISCFQIVFAGKVQGIKEYRWLRSFKDLLNEKADVLYFEEHLHQSRYKQILCSADILLLPISHRSNFAGVLEYYGSTTISGTVNDAARFNKKAIIPDFCAIPSDSQQIFKSYLSAKDLSNTLRNFLVGELELSNLSREEINMNSIRATNQIQDLITRVQHNSRQKTSLIT